MFALRLNLNLCLTGPLPLVSKGTHVIIPLVDHLKHGRWEATVVEKNGNKVKLSVTSPADAVVGLYGLTVTTCPLKGETSTTHNSNKNIIMLFNPWCDGKMVQSLEDTNKGPSRTACLEGNRSNLAQYYFFHGIYPQIFLICLIKPSGEISPELSC